MTAKWLPLEKDMTPIWFSVSMQIMQGTMSRTSKWQHPQMGACAPDHTCRLEQSAASPLHRMPTSKAARSFL